MVQIQIKLSQQLNQTAGIGSKKSIKRRFEFNLKRILALCRLNHISLCPWEIISELSKILLVIFDSLLNHDFDEVFEFFYVLQSPLIQILHQFLTFLFEFNHNISVD